MLQFPRVNQVFNITKNVFSAANIPFSPKPNYVQQTLDFNSVLPLYNQVAMPEPHIISQHPSLHQQIQHSHEQDLTRVRRRPCKMHSGTGPERLFNEVVA